MYQEDKLSSLWTWTEVITILIILTSFLIRMMFGKISNPGLQGSRILITNSGSELTQSLKTQLEDRFQCKVMVLDTQKICEDLLNPIACKEKLDHLLSGFGSVDLLIHNDYSMVTDDFISQEDRNIRDFLNIFMVMIPKMHSSGGGQIVRIKSHPSSIHGMIETRKDYCELAQSLIKDDPSVQSNFCLTIVHMLNPTAFDRIFHADRVIDAIISRKPIVRLTNEPNLFEKVSGLARRALNSFGVSV